MKKRLFLKLGLGFLVLLATLVALPALLPLDSFAPRIAQEVAGRVGLPVTLGGVRLHLLPTPRLVLIGVQIGGKDLEIDSVALVPELGSLFSPIPAMRLIDVKGLRLRDALFKRLPAGKPEAQAPPVALHRVTITDMRISLNGVQLAVDSLAFSVEQRSKGLSVADIRAKLYGGTLSGKLKLDWPRQWQLDGAFAGEGLDVAALARVFAPRQSLSGRLAAEVRLGAQAAKPQWLPDALSADGKFNVARGVLYNFDFASAVKSVVSGKVKGGETRFDELRGNVTLHNRILQLRQVLISSGALSASGKADIQRSGQIAGVFDVDLKHTMGVVGVPVAVSGTLKDPQLGLTTGAKIGAAVGTVLAPGVGTSLGAGIGRFFERKTEK